MAFLKQTLILVASVSTLEAQVTATTTTATTPITTTTFATGTINTSCFETNVRYVPRRNAFGQQRDYMKLLNRGCGPLTTSCGSRPDLNGPVKCQFYCQRATECAFWTYMHWPETGKHECYLQRNTATREVVTAGRQRISGTKCCGACNIGTPGPGFFGVGQGFDQLLTSAGIILAFVVPVVGPFIPLVTAGITIVRHLLTWISQWFYRRRLLQAHNGAEEITRLLQAHTGAEEVTSDLMTFSDEFRNGVNTIAALGRTAGVNNLLVETSRIRDSARRGNDNESIFNALQVMKTAMRSARDIFTTEAERSEYSSIRNEMVYLTPFFEKMEVVMENAWTLKDYIQE